jgi:hypothetical protein
MKSIKKTEFYCRRRRKFFRAAGSVGAVAAGMGTAGVTVLVMVVIAVKIFTQSQSPFYESIYRFFDITLGSSDHLYPGVGKGIYCTAADAAANKNIHHFLCQYEGKGSVTGISGRNDFFADY